MAYAVGLAWPDTRGPCRGRLWRCGFGYGLAPVPWVDRMWAGPCAGTAAAVRLVPEVGPWASLVLPGAQGWSRVWVSPPMATGAAMGGQQAGPRMCQQERGSPVSQGRHAAPSPQPAVWWRPWRWAWLVRQWWSRPRVYMRTCSGSSRCTCDGRHAMAAAITRCPSHSAAGRSARELIPPAAAPWKQDHHPTTSPQHHDAQPTHQHA